MGSWFTSRRIYWRRADSGCWFVHVLFSSKVDVSKINITNLRTPAALLEKIDLPVPKPILVWDYPNFDALLSVRDKIRMLELTPIKTDEAQAYYKTFSRSALGEEMLKMLGDNEFLFAPNRFPYFLPDDVDQIILWINKGVSEETINDKLTTLLDLYGDSILFERSTVTNTPLSRGTIRTVRHIHFWCRKV